MIDPVYWAALLDLAAQESESGDDWFDPEIQAVGYLLATATLIRDAFWQRILIGKDGMGFLDILQGFLCGGTGFLFGVR
ncbi:MAG: hypothetical protein C7B46_02730 [Sulfobacillus benefaciens]|uniref:Uncharacterized protein n=1 Tax=Sulfobacillus benefaciens TaxID=453960 RepID=A0A2T2XKR1_9FIRM|nr:MAG: hypothetical protein C7B46_02730 [Sulfobacillus benefaciens]